MAAENTITCPHCQAELALAEGQIEQLAGTTVTCPACNAEFTLPAAVPEEEKKKIGLRAEAAVPAAGGGGPQCPSCGAAVQSDAVICVACGTNLQTGQKIGSQVAAGAKAAGKPGGARQIIRAIVGVVAVGVIVGSLYSIWARDRREKIDNQSLRIMQVISISRNSPHYAAAIKSIEDALEKCPLATNREDAVRALDWCRTELAQVPARTVALSNEMVRAEAVATNLVEAIGILQGAVTNYPGANNADEARLLLQKYQQENNRQQQILAARNGLQNELQRAQQAKTPAEAIRIIQAAIPRFPNAPNLQEAYDLLAEFQRKADAGK